jgi:GNAT superfamily N-acetyltransferase
MPERGAPIARHEEREYWPYLTDEQRRERGCPVRQLCHESRSRDPSLQVALEKAHAQDVPAIARLRTAVAERLTRDFGQGHWSQGGSENGVVRDMAIPGLYVVRDGAQVVATLRLAAKKPWAIDPAYFSNCKSPLYLTSMAVEPDRQRQGIGRACMIDALRIARERSADAIRLDAYDAAAGAGAFYEKCGFREVGRVVYRTTPLIYYEMLLGQ